MKFKNLSDLPELEKPSEPTPFILHGGPFMLSSPIRMGKYRYLNLTLEELIDLDPEYVDICSQTVAGFIMSPCARMALDHRLQRDCGGKDDLDDDWLDGLGTTD